MDRIRRTCCSVLIGALLLTLLPFAAPAAAASSYLCTGYVGCQEDSYPHFGYRKASAMMWWRMYAGHNCTNYVAYRLVKGGMSAERPWSGTGMAWNWGRAKRRITDRKPMVGAVAWWNANAPGTGSSGHVAFVEKVLSDTKIVISEDSWSGDFHWRRIRKSDGRWPTGFIHFNDRAVEVKQRPTIRGNPAVGNALTASAGTWTQPAKYQFRWRAGGKAIPGATGATLTPRPEFQGRRLSVKVVATKKGYVDGSATSVQTARVTRGTLQTTAAPVISGTPRVDEVLEVRPAAWSPNPDSTTVRWFAGGEPIAGATGKRLRVGQEQIGKRITVRMSAKRDAYRTSTVESSATAPVSAGRIDVRDPFTLTGKPRMGRPLTVSPGTYQPAGADVTYTWLRNGAALPGVTGPTYDLSVADVGRRLSVRATLRHPGYRDKTVLLESEGRVTTDPTLRVDADGKPGRAVVRLRVTAPGVPAPGGRAVVRIGQRQVTGKVVDGRLKVVVDGLAAGTRTLRVHYAGTDVVRPAKHVATVKIRRR